MYRLIRLLFATYLGRYNGPDRSMIRSSNDIQGSALKKHPSTSTEVWHTRAACLVWSASNQKRIPSELSTKYQSVDEIREDELFIIQESSFKNCIENHQSCHLHLQMPCKMAPAAVNDQIEIAKTISTRRKSSQQQAEAAFFFFFLFFSFFYLCSRTDPDSVLGLGRT